MERVADQEGGVTNTEQWLQKIAYKRDELLDSFDGLGGATWTTDEATLGWTAKDVLAHIVAWEVRVATHLPDLLDNRGMSMVGVEADAFNAEQVALRRSRTPRELLNELTAARQRNLEALASASDDDLAKSRDVPWGQVTIERWALQELCDHDAEHAAQLRAWRAATGIGRSLRDSLVDRMAAERAGLLIACLGLDTDTLCNQQVMDDWTVKDTLAHVAAWDDAHTERSRLALAGRESEIVSVDLDERNAALIAERRGWSLDQALQAALDSRRRYLEILSTATDEQLARPIHLPWRETSTWEFARWRAYHDRAHARAIRGWRDAHSSPFSRGPRSLLRATMEAARYDLLRQMDRIPVEEWNTRLVTGEWTLKDVCGHIADWDLYALGALKAAQEGRALPVVAESDVESVNAQHREARRGQTWEQAWADFQNTRAELAGELSGWDDARLAREMDSPLDWARTAYGWFVGQTIWHDLEHAEALRAAQT
jgi:uncharacterized damage-inducible protein DinB